MNQRATPTPGRSEVELPGNMNPVLAMLGFLPMMTIILIALALALEKTPIPLIILLILVAGCCVMLSWTALQVLLGGKLTFDDEGLDGSSFSVGRALPVVINRGLQSHAGNGHIWR